MNEAQNQSKLPRSTVFGSHTVCEIHTYLFYLLTQKQIFKRGENKSVFPKERNRQRAFYALILSPFRVLFGTFCKRQLLFELALTFVGQSSKFISNSHHKPQTQLLTLETECWNDVLHNKGYLAHTQLIAHKPIVTYLYTKYCSHIVSCYSHRK